MPLEDDVKHCTYAPMHLPRYAPCWDDVKHCNLAQTLLPRSCPCSSEKTLIISDIRQRNCHVSCHVCSRRCLASVHVGDDFKHRTHARCARPRPPSPWWVKYTHPAPPFRWCRKEHATLQCSSAMKFTINNVCQWTQSVLHQGCHRRQCLFDACHANFDMGYTL